MPFCITASLRKSKYIICKNKDSMGSGYAADEKGAVADLIVLIFAAESIEKKQEQETQEKQSASYFVQDKLIKLIFHKLHRFAKDMLQ